MVHANGVRHAYLARLQPVGILLLAPLVIAASAAILLALLGIFVTWLLIVAFLLAAIVALDLGRRSMRRLAGPPVSPLRQRAIGIPGR